MCFVHLRESPVLLRSLSVRWKWCRGLTQHVRAVPESLVNHADVGPPWGSWAQWVPHKERGRKRCAWERVHQRCADAGLLLSVLGRKVRILTVCPCQPCQYHLGLMSGFPWDASGPQGWEEMCRERLEGSNSVLRLSPGSFPYLERQPADSSVLRESRLDPLRGGLSAMLKERILVSCSNKPPLHREGD